MAKQKYIKFIAIFLLSLVLAKGLHWRHEKIANLSTPLQPSFSDIVEPTDTKTRVLLFGDSRIAQWRLKWPEKYFVINHGISGSTTFQSLERINRDVLIHKPDWVVIQMGINDIVASRLLFGETRQKILEQATYNIKKIIDQIVMSQSNVIFISLVPDIKADIIRLATWQGSLKNDAEYINASLQPVISGEAKYLDASTIFTHNGVWRVDYAKDALHWNTNAYKALQHTVLDIIEY